MATTSALIAVVNALYTTLNVSAVTASVTPACQVFDGPPLVDRSNVYELYVGVTGLDADDEGTTLVRVPIAFGGGPAGAIRQEAVSVPCAIWALRGNTDQVSVQALRTAVGTIFDAVCAQLAAGSGDLGLGAVLCGGVDVREGALRQIQSPQGYACVLAFNVLATAQN